MWLKLWELPWTNVLIFSFQEWLLRRFSTGLLNQWSIPSQCSPNHFCAGHGSWCGVYLSFFPIHLWHRSLSLNTRFTTWPGIRNPVTIWWTRIGLSPHLMSNKNMICFSKNTQGACQFVSEDLMDPVKWWDSTTHKKISMSYCAMILYWYIGVSENSVPLNPMVLLIIIPIKWLAIIGNINPTFSDKPICPFYWLVSECSHSVL